MYSPHKRPLHFHNQTFWKSRWRGRPPLSRPQSLTSHRPAPPPSQWPWGQHPRGSRSPPQVTPVIPAAVTIHGSPVTDLPPSSSSPVTVTMRSVSLGVTEPTPGHPHHPGCSDHPRQPHRCWGASSSDNWARLPNRERAFLSSHPPRPPNVQHHWLVFRENISFSIYTSIPSIISKYQKLKSRDKDFIKVTRQNGF